MKHRKNIISLFLLLLAWVLPVTAAASTTNLSTSVPADISLTVEVKGNGIVWVENQRITKTSVVSIPRNEDITISLQSGTGYRIASVHLNGADISNKLKNGKLTLDGMAFDSILSAHFVKRATVLPGDNPPTGDGIAKSVICCSMSMMALFVLLDKKRK